MKTFPAITTRPAGREHSPPLGAIQIHIDPTWAIAKTFGVASSPKNYVYQRVVPVLLELLRRHGLKATFMVIGEDLRRKGNLSTVKEICRGGHEIANHSLSHPIGFRHLSRREKEKEIADSEKLIEDATQSEVRGFAAPAYDIDEVALRILEERNYLYDSSVYPSHFSLSAKTYRHLKSILVSRASGSAVKPSSWGRLSYIFAPRLPYHPSRRNLLRRGNSRILEIPFSLIPFWGMPFYHYFCLFAGSWYFRAGLGMLRAMKRELNYLIHPTEIFDPEEVIKNDPHFLSIPTIRIPYGKKLKFLDHALGEIKSRYRIITLKELARRYENIK